MNAHDYCDADDYTRLLNEPINVELNALTERVALATPRMTRGYLGASAAGDECMRKDSIRLAVLVIRGRAAEAADSTAGTRSKRRCVHS